MKAKNSYLKSNLLFNSNNLKGLLFLKLQLVLDFTMSYTFVSFNTIGNIFSYFKQKELIEV